MKKLTETIQKNIFGFYISSSYATGKCNMKMGKKMKSKERNSNTNLKLLKSEKHENKLNAKGTVEERQDYNICQQKLTSSS